MFLWLVGYSLLLTVGFTAFQYYREKQFKAEELDARLQLVNTYILTEIREGRPVEEIDLSEFHPLDSIRISVISGSGQIVYDNALDSLPQASHLDRTEISQAIRNGSGYTVRRHSLSTGSNYFYSAKRGDDGIIVRTAVPYSTSLSALLRADYGFIWITFVIAIVMCVMGYFATRRLGHHITRLHRFAEDVENGGIVSICDSDPLPDDELSEISSNIVRLYARLQQAYADRDAEHRAALHEQQEKQRIKRQLTNNINHELKTPVASVRVCLETLIDHPDLDPEKRLHFLQRAAANTERLQRLLADISLITRMEDGARSIEKSRVDLAEIIAESVSDREMAAASKGIVIRDDVPGPIPAEGNPVLLEAIFNNLIDNAIAYSGATTIRISVVSEDDSRVTLGVADNGVGVADEHLPRLFERFYRIDKGRSRSAGGTGLGLSIVRNAVAFHGGSISVERPHAGGLLFRITLPKGTSSAAEMQAADATKD